MNYSKNTAGFTLIELLVVIAIIGVLSGVVLQSLKGARTKSQNATRLSDIDQINKSLELYFTRQASGAGTFPSTAGSWGCIGLTSGTCWGASAYAPAAALNTALTGNISKIPKDPILTGVAGDYYLYNSSYAGYNGTGAYLRWALTGTTAAKDCGRAKQLSFDTTGNTENCTLYLGK